MQPVVTLDDALDASPLEGLRTAVLSSKLLGDSPLGGTFLATRGFSVTFHRDRVGDVEARFPFLEPFLALAIDDGRVRGVQRRPLLGGPPRVNACYLNVLVVPPGAGVGRHVDATLGPPSGRVIPEAVAVLYVDVPGDLQGGELVLSDEKAAGAEIRRVTPRAGSFVLFAGALGHEVTPVRASRPRVSVVCELYALPPGVLSLVPRLKVHSRSAFQAVLDEVRGRGH